MNIKNIALLTALAITGFSAHAADVTNTITLQGSQQTGYSAGLSDPTGFEVNHTVAGSFSDTFTFNYNGDATVDVWLTTSVTADKLATQQIIFTSATLNGMPLSLDDPLTMGSGNDATIFNGGGLFQVLASGNYTLVVNGYAGLLNSTASGISASYSGGINVMPSAVPEPETYALMLGGLVAVGFMSRRRKVR